MNKYYYIAKINFINNFVYITETLAKSAFIAIILFILSQLWIVAFSTTNSINGFTLTSYFEGGSASYSWLAIGV
jgi:hypothetical protein